MSFEPHASPGVLQCDDGSFGAIEGFACALLRFRLLDGLAPSGDGFGGSAGRAQAFQLRPSSELHSGRPDAALVALAEHQRRFTARKAIRVRSRRRWLASGEAAPDQLAASLPEESREGVRELYALLARLPPDARLAFTRRQIEGMAIGELAGVCRVSLSTVKRRVARADKLFQRLLSEYPALWERGLGASQRSMAAGRRRTELPGIASPGTNGPLRNQKCENKRRDTVRSSCCSACRPAASPQVPAAQVAAAAAPEVGAEPADRWSGTAPPSTAAAATAA